MFGEVYDSETGLPVNALEYNPWRYWFRVSVGAAVTAGQVIQYFNTQPATGTRTTNMPSPGAQFPQSWTVYVLGMAIRPAAGTTPADLILMYDNFYVQIMVGQNKIWTQGLMHDFGSGGGMSGQTTLNASSIVTNGTPNAASIEPFPVPLKLSHGLTFEIQIICPTATTLSVARNIDVVLPCWQRIPA